MLATKPQYKNTLEDAVVESKESISTISWLGLGLLITGSLFALASYDEETYNEEYIPATEEEILAYIEQKLAESEVGYQSYESKINYLVSKLPEHWPSEVCYQFESLLVNRIAGEIEELITKSPAEHRWHLISPYLWNLLGMQRRLRIPLSKGIYINTQAERLYHPFMTGIITKWE